MDLGEKLFELRKAKNLTQDDVAEKINVTRQTVSKWETNQSVPDFDKIVPLCDLFEISTDELLKGKTEEENVEGEEKENKESLFKRNKVDYENMTAAQIKQKSAEVVSSSILIFFIAIAYVGIGTAALEWNPVFVGCTFVVLLAWGVTRIIKHFMSIPNVEKTEEERKQTKVEREITDIIMVIATIVYFVVSFLTMAWHITWIIFIIGNLIARIAKLIFALKGEEDNEE